MKRALARGRLLPQGLSTDPRMGRLSLKAVALFPLMWVNGDDQGRITGDPDEIKYAVCPNIEHITRQDVPALLTELQEQKIILCYNSSKAPAIQMLDWWQEHKLQWAWPSQYEAPDGWIDHLRYKASAKEVVTKNWPPEGNQLILPGLSGENPGENPAESSGEGSGENPGENPAESSGEGSGENPGESSPEPAAISPLTTPRDKKEERGKRKEERGISPEDSGEPSPSAKSILNKLIDHFRIQFGRIQAADPGTVIPRDPSPKEEAQLRDLAIELSAVMPAHKERLILPAFKEAAGQNKMHISYVRRILLDWLKDL